MIEQVLQDVRERGLTVSLEEVNILENAKLARMHAEEIPVVRINGRGHSYWHVDADRLTAALEKAAKKGLFRGKTD